MPIIHAEAQEAPAQNALTVAQVVQKLEDQLKYISTLELKWKQTLVVPPSPRMAEQHAQNVKKLEAISPSSEQNARRRDLDILNEKAMEESHSFAKVSYSIWTLRYHDYGRFHGSNTSLKGDKKSLSAEYIGETEGRHQNIDHSNRCIDASEKSNILFNSMTACPPLVLIHRLHRGGYPNVMPEGEIASRDNTSIEVTFKFLDNTFVKAHFSLPGFTCTKVTMTDVAGREEIMESTAPWKSVSSVPFLPAVWKHTFSFGGEGTMERTWEFIEAKDVGTDGYKAYQIPKGYHALGVSEGIP
ncbi:hypothetical protein [Roseimicrobium sp. ORNL1]|uniref:hypothetical protein n=1 Tax=Roseimicrobium sp. ORNL1 TaxID=2711231 RepID=UPI0013E1A4EA|nr:hypothetical protein [Roseimicrobium sp. ORNL1]QIF02399.1 hypothetical protein G5S37_12985 [Roseimicrobium sp. ORNL1]